MKKEDYIKMEQKKNNSDYKNKLIMKEKTRKKIVIGGKSRGNISIRQDKRPLRQYFGQPIV
jgi:hypothetical protein